MKKYSISFDNADEQLMAQGFTAERHGEVFGKETESGCRAFATYYHSTKHIAVELYYYMVKSSENNEYKSGEVFSATINLAVDEHND